LATQLNLPIINRQKVSAVRGKNEVNVHLGHIVVPRLIFGAFAGVHLNSWWAASRAATFNEPKNDVFV
jgi:hypothetical protein